jgi:hypothetical protein
VLDETWGSTRHGFLLTMGARHSQQRCVHGKFYSSPALAKRWNYGIEILDRLKLSAVQLWDS